jgi:hypothetical protein
MRTSSTLGAKSLRSSVYASNLEKKLDHEKRARHRLEKEVEELKRLSSAISTQLGWNKIK